MTVGYELRNLCVTNGRFWHAPSATRFTGVCDFDRYLAWLVSVMWHRQWGIACERESGPSAHGLSSCLRRRTSAPLRSEMCLVADSWCCSCSLVVVRQGTFDISD